MEGLPHFKPDKWEQHWIKQEQITAKVVKTLWRHAATADRRDTDFFKVLIYCSWVNKGSDEARRTWRNRRLAEWLGLEIKAQDDQVSAALAEKLGMALRTARWIIRTPTGITDYYKALRPIFFDQVDVHSRTIGKAFRLVSERQSDVEVKIGQVAGLIFDLPDFPTANNGRSSLMNGLAPALACLDVQSRFPIMNARTKHMLGVLGKKPDVSGALSLTRLIGQYGIKDAFYLDVYAQTRADDLPPKRRGARIRVPEPTMVGLKSEEESVAILGKRKITIRKRHNALLNRFKRAVEWNYPLKECEYDLLLEDWRPGRWLLIEAKTEMKGVVGRSQIRQAIGQLFDYRWRSFQTRMNEVDLALLTPSKPDRDILGLLSNLGIEALWFEGQALKGTVALIGGEMSD